MGITQITLTGRHVRLEPLALAHQDELIEAAADGELWNTQVTIIPQPVGMKDYIQAALDGQSQERELPFVIISKLSNQIVGTTRFYEISRADRKAAIGYT